MEPELENTKSDIVKALAKAKKSFKAITKNKKVSAGAYSYSYAELSQILDAVTPALCDNDLILTQDVVGEELVTKLMHSSGQVIKSTIAIVAAGKPGPQGYASSVTYSRRYSICNLLCISADDDLDAADVQDYTEKSPHDSLRTQNTTQNTPGYSKRQAAQRDSFISEKQIGLMMAVAAKNGWSELDVKEYWARLGIKTRKEVNKVQLDKFLENVAQFPKSIGHHPA